jgi:hypothetical protein
MAPVLKTGVPERVPGVRIPTSPPLLLLVSNTLTRILIGGPLLNSLPQLP